MTERLITDQPRDVDYTRFDPGFGRRFIVTVDAEEEFDWQQPLRPSGHTLHSVSRLAKFQAFCETHGVAPIYMVDYPIATSTLAAEILRDAVQQGRAEIGVQLHPWVSPPFEEDVNQYNSFAGNLPYALEQAKFCKLRDTIQQNFGAAPRIYRAGRYGVGPNTPAILRDNGIAVDTSARALFDYSAGGGPNFRDLPLRPWWVGQPGGLLELPLSTVYTGLLRKQGRWLYPKLWRTPALRGLFARLRLLERIPLTPEGVSKNEVARGIATAIAEDLPILVFSFHSPSLQPGHTPYVRDEDDLDTFYDWWRSVFAQLAASGVRATTIAEIMHAAELA